MDMGQRMFFYSLSNKAIICSISFVFAFFSQNILAQQCLQTIQAPIKACGLAIEKVDKSVAEIRELEKKNDKESKDKHQKLVKQANEDIEELRAFFKEVEDCNKSIKENWSILYNKTFPDFEKDLKQISEIHYAECKTAYAGNGAGYRAKIIVDVSEKAIDKTHQVTANIMNECKTPAEKLASRADQLKNSLTQGCKAEPTTNDIKTLMSEIEELKTLLSITSQQSTEMAEKCRVLAHDTAEPMSKMFLANAEQARGMADSVQGPSSSSTAFNKVDTTPSAQNIQNNKTQNRITVHGSAPKSAAANVSKAPASVASQQRKTNALNAAGLNKPFTNKDLAAEIFFGFSQIDPDQKPKK